MEPLRLASEEQNEFFLKEIDRSRNAFLHVLHRVTFRGYVSFKEKAKRRAKNKVARKQRRVNRLRSE